MNCLIFLDRSLCRLFVHMDSSVSRFPVDMHKFCFVHGHRHIFI
jgi:hypothetical protein